MKVEIVEARPEHIPQVLSICREFEREAYERLGIKETFTYLRGILRHSAEAWVGKIDDEVACLWGVDQGSLISSSAMVWLITTKVLDDHPFVFVRHSQIRLADLRKRYHYIHGVVQVENERSTKWLRWLGFKLSEPEMYGGYFLRKFSLVS